MTVAGLYGIAFNWIAASLRHYVKNYGLSKQAVATYAKRGWPLDDPTQLLNRMMNSPGKRPETRKLMEFVRSGRGKQPKPETRPCGEEHSTITIVLGSMVMSREITTAQIDQVV